MSILEPFFATSKKHKSRLTPLGLMFVLVVLALFQTSCIVTESIEFTDKVNHPPKIVNYLPANTIISVCRTDEKSFTITVWDPDTKTSDSFQMGARLLVDSMYGKTLVDETCQPPLQLLSSNSEQQEFTTGTLVEIKCTVNFSKYNLQEDDLLPARVTVSDLGFTAGGKAREAAHTVDQNWVIQVEQCN